MLIIGPFIFQDYLFLSDLEFFLDFLLSSWSFLDLALEPILLY